MTTIKHLIDDKGRLRAGVFCGPVERINYRDFDLRSVMDRPLPRWLRGWRFNQFQFISVAGPHWVFGLAVVDLKLLGNAFFYLYDFESGAMHEQSFLQPLALGTSMEPLPEAGLSVFRKGDVHVRITPQGNGRRLEMAAPGNIRAEMELHADDHPLRLACPAGYGGWVFTRKSAGLPVSGSVQWGNREWHCDERTCGTIDWSCGFMRRETAWNWACLAGRLADGRSIGLNLAAGVNETGMTENALWLDGTRIKLDLARFEYDRYAPEAPWRVTTSDGRVDLYFQPSGVRRERMNALVLASNFRQYIGTFEGTVRDDSGTLVPVAGLRGLMEDHFARW